MTGGERAVLDHWLDLYRGTVLLTIAGLDAEQLTRCALPPSSMSPIGVVRHLTEVETYWLRVVLVDKQDVPDYYCTSVSQDGDFDDVDPATAAADVAAWTDLAVPVHGLGKGKQVNLRWILTQPRRGVRPPPRPHGPGVGCPAPRIICVSYSWVPLTVMSAAASPLVIFRHIEIFPC